MKHLTRFALLSTLLAASASAQTLTGNAIKVVIMNDMTAVYAEVGGPGSVKAAQMAADDFMKANKAYAGKVTVIGADHQNKVDIGSNKANELIERQGADVIIDLPTSSVALAVSEIGKNKKIPVIVVGGGTTALTNEKCNKYTFHYAYDNYMLANGTGSTVTKKGGSSWYIVYPNYAFGQDLNRQMTAAITENGGKVLGSDATPFPNTDFSSYLLKAQGNKPKIFGTLQAGGDLVNVVKQYNEFGLKKQGIGLGIGLLFENDIASLGQDAFAGAIVTVPWFQGLDARSKQWAQQFKKVVGKDPTWAQAGVYSATMTYLQAVARARSDSGDAVVKALEGAKVSDFYIRNGLIRPEDHRVIFDVYTVQVKSKAQSKDSGDLFTRLSTIPAARAFTPLNESKCKMP